MIEDRYWTEWDEDVDIPWRADGRRRLNQVIRMVNDWVVDGRALASAPHVLRNIDMGRKTFAKEACGGDWDADLEAMQAYVRECLEDDGRCPHCGHRT